MVLFFLTYIQRATFGFLDADLSQENDSWIWSSGGVGANWVPNGCLRSDPAWNMIFLHPVGGYI